VFGHLDAYVRGRIYLGNTRGNFSHKIHNIKMVQTIMGWAHLLRLLSGDIELNPGPEEKADFDIDHGKIVPFDTLIKNVVFQDPLIPVCKENKLSFISVFRNERYKREVSNRLSNALFHCNCELYSLAKNSKDCYLNFIRLLISSNVISDSVGMIYNKVIGGESCFICLHQLKPDNEKWTCADLCKQRLIQKFKESNGD
jgi:hypothetical protein